ncbi:MAG: hypothetical protein GZ094_17155 [Mariniphaga sp.]|nr:hypothetical protein [Mariniphaga sp.]
MNAHQDEKLQMYHLVITICENHKSEWITNAVFAAIYNLWKLKIPMIEQYRDDQLSITSGIIANKLVIRNSMTEKAFFIANRIQSFANAGNDVELSRSVQYLHTDIKRARDNNVVGICNKIFEVAG